MGFWAIVKCKNCGRYRAREFRKPPGKTSFACFYCSKSNSGRTIDLIKFKAKSSTDAQEKVAALNLPANPLKSETI